MTPTKQKRLDLIRERVAAAPLGHKAEAADRCRQIMAAADRAVEEAIRPTFDGYEILAAIAEAIEDNTDVDQTARRDLATVLLDARDRRAAEERITGRRDVRLFT